MKPKKVKKAQKGGRVAAAKPSATENYHSMYLYYLKYLSTKETPEISRMYYYSNKHVPIKNLGERIEILTANAYNDGNDPPPYGTKFTDLERRRKGYFVVVVEGRKFDRAKPFKLKYDGAHKHTFSDPKYFEAVFLDQIGNEKRLDTGYSLNKMQSKKKYDNGSPGNLDDKEGEEFELRFSFDGGRIFPDSGGTNMGPPVPPP